MSIKPKVKFLFATVWLAAIIFAAALPALADPFLVTNPDPGAGYFNVISGNAVCTGSGAPVAGCTGVGTGTLMALPSSLTTTNLAPDPTGTYGLKLDLATLPAVTSTVTYTVASVACVATTATVMGGCAAPSPFSQFQQVPLPAPAAGLKLAP